MGLMLSVVLFFVFFSSLVVVIAHGMSAFTASKTFEAEERKSDWPES